MPTDGQQALSRVAGTHYRPRPLGTGRAASTATGSGKLLRLARRASIRPCGRPLVRSPLARRLTCPRVLGPTSLVRLRSPDPVGTLSGLGIVPVSGQLCGTIVQRAVVEVLNAVYEVDFRGFSYGFRPGR